MELQNKMTKYLPRMFFTEFINVLHELKLKYGDAYRVHFLSYPYVILSHPKYIEVSLSKKCHKT